MYRHCVLILTVTLLTVIVACGPTSTPAPQPTANTPSSPSANPLPSDGTPDQIAEAEKQFKELCWSMGMHPHPTWGKEIPTFKIGFNKTVTDADLKALPQVPFAHGVFFWHNEVTLTGLLHLKDRAGLVSLNLQPFSLGDEGLGKLAALPHLTSIDLNDRTITPAGYARLKDFPALVALHLSEDHSVTDGDVKEITRLDRLAYLRVKASNLSAAGLKLFLEMKGLKRLEIRNPPFTTAAVGVLKDLGAKVDVMITPSDTPQRQFAQWKQQGILHLFYFARTAGNARPRTAADVTAISLPTETLDPATDDTLKLLTEYSGLTDLDVSFTDITDDGVKQILELFPKLTNLNLAGTKITDSSLTRLAGTKLTSLGLLSTQVTDNGLGELSKMTTLKALDVRATRLSVREVTKFKAAHPTCEVKE